MMHTYARIEGGIVMEIIAPMADANGNEIPIAERFVEEIVAALVDVTSVAPQPQQWWTYADLTFSPPVE